MDLGDPVAGRRELVRGLTSARGGAYARGVAGLAGLAAAVAAVLTLAVPHATAVDCNKNWDGGGTDDLWSTLANWDDNTLPDETITSVSRPTRRSFTPPRAPPRSGASRAWAP